MKTDNNSNGSVLVIDDNHLILDVINTILHEYNFDSFVYSNALDAINDSRKIRFDVVLTDIRMPEVSGLQLLEKMHLLHPEKPVILMTANAELETAVEAINRGAFDLIIKPFIPEHFINTLRKAVEHSRFSEREKSYKKLLEQTLHQKTEDLSNALITMDNMNRDVVQRFTKMAEYRDTDTGNHISRIGLYSSELAKALKMPGDFVNAIKFASSMHDIGKIGIPDSILLKPGKLTPEETAIMKTHPSMGKEILEGSPHYTIQMAELIAWCHHERWDGTGYPRGLKRYEIPLEGMIVMLVDQYDALRSKRPYKSSLSHEETFTILVEGNGRTRPEHFNPDVMNAFIKIAPAFNEIFHSLEDIHSVPDNISDVNCVLCKG
jgi:putative two-component system response regulator